MKKIIITSFLVFVTFGCNAQLKKDIKEKIRTYKIAFLTEKLNLTESEAQTFWPIYNTYDKKIIKLRREGHVLIRRKIKTAGGLENISEKQAKDIIAKMQSITNERHRIKTEFYSKINNVLSYKKLLTLEISEHEFDRKLMRKFRHGKKRNKK